jgi:hypothetical protein
MSRALSTVALACAFAFAATSASGAFFKPLSPPIAPQAPQTNVLHAQKPIRMQQLRNPPVVYSLSQRAAAVAAAGHMLVPPDLSAPFTLTPAHTFIPGVASLRFESSYQLFDAGSPTGDPNNPPLYAFCGGACFPMDPNQHIQGIIVSFQAMQGKHYVFDCRIVGGDNIVNYRYFGVPTSGGSSGTAQIGEDGHVLMTTGVTASGGGMTFAMSLDYSPDPNTSGWGFWGCDVSSF